MFSALRHNSGRILIASGAVAGTSLYSAHTTYLYAKELNVGPVKDEITKLIDEDAEKRSDGSSLTGTFVRLAWHCAGSYSKKDGDGGSNGALMRFAPEKDWGGNAGLLMAREALEPIKARFPEISYADLYVLAGITAVENAGGPTIPFRSGRVDFDDGSNSPPHDNRLPAADCGGRDKNTAHLRDVFYRMGFNDKEIVILSGAHALGRCHENASGYWGPWTFAENTFSNEYFRLLVEERWSQKTTHNGKPWTGPDQYEDSTGKLMMLPSDIALVQDPIFRKYVEVYAKDEDLFFKDFAQTFAKLLELGVPFPAAKPWYQFW